MGRGRDCSPLAEGRVKMWEVRGTKRVVKSLSKLNRETRLRYDQAFSRLSKEPRAGKALSGYDNLFGFPFSAPGGEHRIIYRLMTGSRVVYVVLVGSREEIYDLLKRSGIR